MTRADIIAALRSQAPDIRSLGATSLYLFGSAYVHDKNWVRFGPPQAFVNWDTVIGMIGR